MFRLAIIGQLLLKAEKILKPEEAHIEKQHPESDALFVCLKISRKKNNKKQQKDKQQTKKTKKNCQERSQNRTRQDKHCHGLCRWQRTAEEESFAVANLVRILFSTFVVGASSLVPTLFKFGPILPCILHGGDHLARAPWDANI
jgi:hypothetical protein